MDVDLRKIKIHFTIREILILFTFLGGLVAHAIRTEVQNETLTKDVANVRVELRQCQDKLARR